MRRLKTVIAILCVRLLIAPVFAEESHPLIEPGGPFASFTRPYRTKEVPPINVANSNRLAAVMDLYWDLVTFNESVRVQQQAVATSTKLYEDNKKQVEVGMMAPIEVVRAEAQVATDQQNLTLAETQLLQQETILKNALSRTGVASPAVAEARIVPTDRIRVPDVEPITPIQDLMATALSARPELSQNRIQVTNQEITLHGSKNGLRPTLDVVAAVTNNALAGQVNN